MKRDRGRSTNVRSQQHGQCVSQLDIEAIGVLCLLKISEFCHSSGVSGWDVRFDRTLHCLKKFYVNLHLLTIKDPNGTL